MGLIMRDAEVKDFDELNEIFKEISAGLCDRDKALQILGSINADENKKMIVAEDSETHEVLGTLFGMAFEDICDTGRPILLVENVAVKPTAQGKGVGRALFEYIEEWSVERDCHYEILVSGNSRIGAHKFYNAIGFEEVKGYKKMNLGE